MSYRKPTDAQAGKKGRICWQSLSPRLIRDQHLFVIRTLVGGMLLLFVLPKSGLATHIVGGQLELVRIDAKPGHFRVTMTYYYNEAQTANLPQPTSNAVIFRKSDDRKMAEFTLLNTTLANRPPVVFANPGCALINNLRVSRVVYEADIQLDPTEYSDAQGYYLIQQNCCRNAAISNLVNPQGTPFLFYLEFPALIRSGQLITNSSPVFQPLTGDYVCLGSPFTFSTMARDPDGDVLRYSLVSPLAGTFMINANLAVIKPAPYPEVNWRPGFGALTAIPGNPALTIDERTGILSVVASQPGLFVFSVRVEEFRNGIKLGEVRRDLQMLVIDCPVSPLPVPVVTIQSQPVGTTEARLCVGKTVRLQTTANATWNYQWRRNAVFIPGAINPVLDVVEPGTYTVAISPVSGCSQWVNSGSVQINDASETVRLLADDIPAICPDGGIARLRIPFGSSYVCQWYWNGTELPKTLVTLSADKPGRYWATLHDTEQGCDLHTDTISVTLRANPLVSLTSISATTALCTGDSLQLLAVGARTYTWAVDGRSMAAAVQPSFFAKMPGTYTVTGTDTAGCKATSMPFVVSALTQLSVTFDSIPEFCGIDQPLYQLKGTPTGGFFSGTGVTGNTFDPQAAGIGVHQLTYSIRSAANPCYNGMAQRQAIIGSVPTVDLPTELTAYKGATVNLQPLITDPKMRYSWQPTTFLTFWDRPNVQAVNLENDIVYRLTATNNVGCQYVDSVQIRVYQPIWVPDAFTPNDDGLNDSWQLAGIEAYPQARLTVYNRWGEVVYQTTSAHTNPFDGKYAGQVLPSGVYSYVLRPGPDRPLLKGSVLLIR